MNQDEHSIQRGKGLLKDQKIEQGTHLCWVRDIWKAHKDWHHRNYRIPAKDTQSGSDCENTKRESWEWGTGSKQPELFRMSESWKTEAEKLLQIKGDTRKWWLNAIHELVLEHKWIIKAFIIAYCKSYWNT